MSFPRQTSSVAASSVDSSPPSSAAASSPSVQSDSQVRSASVSVVNSSAALPSATATSSAASVAESSSGNASASEPTSSTASTSSTAKAVQSSVSSDTTSASSVSTARISPVRAIQSASQVDAALTLVVHTDCFFQARDSSDSASPSSNASASGAASASASDSAPPASSASAASSAANSVSSEARSASASDSAAPSSSSAPPPSSSQPISSASAISSSPPSLSSAPVSGSASTDFNSLTVSFNSVSGTSLTSFTTFVTSVDGQLTTITSALPTSLSTAGSTITGAERTRIIAGATAAGVALILFLLGGLFVYKRHKGRKREFSEAIGRVRREAHGAGGVGLLDDEGFDDDDSVPMRRYQDNVVSTHSRSLNASATSLGAPQSPAPSIFRQRAETGSMFREEVYPPPQGPHVDPLIGLGSDLGLNSIVNDVMGPPNPAHAHHTTVPSMSSATSSLYADPFRDISHTSAPSDPSLYYDRPGTSSSLSHHTTGARPSTPQSLLGLPAGAAGTPKKPSPLANAGAPPSSANWLSRSPKKHGVSGSQSSNEGL